MQRNTSTLYTHIVTTILFTVYLFTVYHVQGRRLSSSYNEIEAVSTAFVNTANIYHHPPPSFRIKRNRGTETDSTKTEDKSAVTQRVLKSVTSSHGVVSIQVNQPRCVRKKRYQHLLRNRNESMCWCSFMDARIGVVEWKGISLC